MQKRKPANYPQNSASPNSGVLCLCREKRSVLGKTWLQRQPKRLSLLFDYFAKSRVCLAFPKAKTRFLHKTPAYNRKKRSFLQFCAFAKKNRSFFDKPRLQRLPKRSSVPVHGTGKSSVHNGKLCARNHSGKRGKDFPKTKKNFKPSHSFRFRAG